MNKNIDMTKLRLEINELLDVVDFFIGEETSKKTQESLALLCLIYFFPNTYKYSNNDEINYVMSVLGMIQDNYYVKEFIFSVPDNAEEIIKLLNLLKEENCIN